MAGASRPIRGACFESARHADWMQMSIQSKPDAFSPFASAGPTGTGVSELALSRAHVRLFLTAIPLLNDRLVAHAEQDRFVPRRCGLRLFAAARPQVARRIIAQTSRRKKTPAFLLGFFSYN